MAQLVRFQHRQVLEERQAVAALVEKLQQIPDGVLQQLPAGHRLAISRAAHVLQRVACPDTEQGLWPGGFSMLSRIQTEAVWEAIDALPSTARRNQVHKAFRLILLNVQQNTGEIMLDRTAFAARIGTAPCHPPCG